MTKRLWALWLFLSLCSIASAQTHNVTLNWTASTSASLSGYNVYRGTISGGPYTKLTASPISGTTYVDTAITAGQTYYYVTTAVSGTVESAFSNQAKAGAPPILSFTASPATISAGGSSTLTWSTSQAASASINQGIGAVAVNSSTTVHPTATTTYALTATNFLGSSTATTTVTVNAVAVPPVISSFTASPATIASGQQTTLNWSISGATSLSIDNGIGDVTGHTFATASPTATTTYTITATNAAGSVNAKTTVTVTGSGGTGTPVISSFTASPGTISQGGISTLSWVTSGATTLSISPGIGDVTAATGTAQRVYGPEAGLQFGSPPSGTNYGSFGEAQRAVLSNFSFAGAAPNFLALVNTFLYSENASSESFTLFPYTKVQQYRLQGTLSGVHQDVLNGFGSIGGNVADPGFENYVFGPGGYVQGILIPSHNPNLVKGVPTDANHPIWVSNDHYDRAPDYSWWGPTGIVWDPGLAQNASQWYNDWSAWYSYARTNCPMCRVSPHLGGMADWSQFQNVYKDTPGMEFEYFVFSQLPTYGASARSTLYNSVVNGYWFANLAPPVFLGTGDSPTRVLQWGTALDNSADLHSAVALYAMVRGANSFFDFLDGAAHVGIVPSTWLPTITLLGNPAGSTSPQVVKTAGGHAVGDGYNLLSRTYRGGVAYFNMTGSTQTITPPAGAKEWNGNSVTSLTLADGQGDVVLVAGVTGGGGTGSIAVSPAVTTTYVLSACNSVGCSTAATTVNVAPGAPVISSFTASPGTISSGGSSTLSWSVSGADSVSINQGIGTVTGLTQKSVSPTVSTTYTITATNSIGSVTAQAAVCVGTCTGSGGGGGSRAYWRVNLISNRTDGTNTLAGGDVGEATEIEFHTSIGGSDVANGGTAIAGSSIFTLPSDAFDDDLTTAWATNQNVGSGLAWIGYHFATPQNIQEFSYTNPRVADGDNWKAFSATSMNLDWSDDGSAWTTACSFVAVTDGLYAFPDAPGGGKWTAPAQTVTFPCPSIPAAAPTINSFTATPTTITSGGSSRLSWSVTGATSLSIDQGIGTVTSLTSTVVSPVTNTTYTLTASNGAGNTTAQVTVNVTGSGGQLPVINFFTASPTTITQGASSTLSWSVSGATSLAIDQGVGTVTSLTSTTVSPTQDTIYTLSATNSTGTATQTVTVHVQTGNVGQAPVITSFTATPDTISAGASSQLAWVVTGASSLTIDQGVGIVTSLSSTLVTPSQTTTYTLTATNSVGVTTATVTVTINVSGALPAILSFIATPPRVLSGGLSILSWTTNHDETSLSIDQGIGDVTGLTSFAVNPLVTTTYTLTATNAQGSVTATATVTVVAQCAP